MYIPQYQINNLRKFLTVNKAVIIYGPRRCGKTTLLKNFIQSVDREYLFVNGEDVTVGEYLSSQSIDVLKSFVGGKRLLIIDEAQKIKNIGENIKLMLDSIEGLEIIASGSSAFDLARHTGEPLTGRKFTLKMFPLAQFELAAMENPAQTKGLLESRLIYGSYPEVILNQDNNWRQAYLKEIVSSYLYKDVLEFEGIRHADSLIKLLQSLAFQIGKEVSFTELGVRLLMSKNTVERYLDLLEKAFVIFKLRGFSRNLRKEIVKNPRYYFYDIGVRNALINNFNSLSLRDDAGMLWENYVIVEMIKKQEYHQIQANNYFWRTYDRKEIDLIQEKDGKLYGYEIKLSKDTVKLPTEWLKTYPGSEFTVINKDNYLEYIA